MNRPLMPKATAVWLVDNTSLTFDQIAAFCSLHPLEVKGIADGEVAVGIQGQDPVAGGQLTREEIARCENNPGSRLQMAKVSFEPPERRSKGPRYTPLSKRQDRPNAIAWLLRNHPELSDAQVAKMVGTTKPTIQSVRDRTHWNMSNIKPQDPVTLGLCSQTELDAAVQKAQDRLRKVQEREEREQARARAAQLAAAEAAGMPSTQPYVAPDAPAAETPDRAPDTPAAETPAEVPDTPGEEPDRAVPTEPTVETVFPDGDEDRSV